MKHLTVNSLALGNLKSRRKQYTLMIIGIVLAMTFSSGILLFMQCMNDSIEELRFRSYGKQDFMLTDCGSLDFEQLRQDRIAHEYGFAGITGYGYTDPERFYDNMAIAYYDEEAVRLSYPVLLQGTMPAKKGEIAVERSALMQLGFDAVTGQSITLKYLPCGSGAKEEERAYTVTGILADKRLNIVNAASMGPAIENIPCAIISSEEYNEAGANVRRVCYLNFAQYEPASNYDENTPYLRLMRILEQEKIDYSSSSFGKGVIFDNYSAGNENIRYKTVLSAVLSLALLLASCIGIVNAFNTNLSERRRQIGMLRAVGTTKRQIITIFGREALLICLISAPFSLCLSVLSVWGITKLLGSEIVFSFHWLSLALCAAAGVTFVMLAALIPLVRAAKITPMQAIRSIDMTHKMKTKHIRSQKSFDTSRLIAKRNLLFHKGRYVCVSILMALSILISCLGFNAMQLVLKEFHSYEYDYWLFISTYSTYGRFVNYEKLQTGFSEGKMQDVEASRLTGEVATFKTAAAVVEVSERTPYSNLLLLNENLFYNYDGYPTCEEAENGNFSFHSAGEYAQMKEKYGIQNSFYGTTLVRADSDMLRKYNKVLASGKIDVKKILSGEEVVVFAPDNLRYCIYSVDGHQWGSIGFGGYNESSDVSQYIEAKNDCLRVGDEITYTVFVTDTEEYGEGNHVPDGCTRVTKTAKIGAIVSSPSPDSEQSVHAGPTAIITSPGVFDSVYPGAIYTDMKVNLRDGLSKDDADIDKEMMDLLQNAASNTPGTYIRSNYQTNQNNEQTYSALLAALLCVMLLMFMIITSLINNSLTAQIRDSKQKIGTLRTVGASERELVKSFARQLASMMAAGIAAGFALYALICLGVFVTNKFIVELSIMDLTPQLWQALLFCTAMFAVCEINLRSKIHKTLKSSVVENIREL